MLDEQRHVELDPGGLGQLSHSSVTTSRISSGETSASSPNTARSDCVSENAAAFEIEYAGIIGNAATAARDRTLTMAPRERVSNGRKAWVTPCVPKRLTARCRSSVARSLTP